MRFCVSTTPCLALLVPPPPPYIGLGHWEFEAQLNLQVNHHDELLFNRVVFSFFFSGLDDKPRYDAVTKKWQRIKNGLW